MADLNSALNTMQAGMNGVNNSKPCWKLMAITQISADLRMVA